VEGKPKVGIVGVGLSYDPRPEPRRFRAPSPDGATARHERPTRGRTRVEPPGSGSLRQAKRMRPPRRDDPPSFQRREGGRGEGERRWKIDAEEKPGPVLPIARKTRRNARSRRRKKHEGDKEMPRAPCLNPPPPVRVSRIENSI